VSPARSGEIYQLNGRAVWSDDHIVGVQVSVDYAAAIAARGRAGEEHPTDRGKGGCTDHASCLQRSGTEIACSAIMQPVFGLGRCDRPLEIPVQIIAGQIGLGFDLRSEEHTSELQSLMRISYAVFCLKKKK